MLTLEERQAIMAANPPEIGSLHSANAYFDWSWRGCGFGQLHFSFHPETGKVTCDSEHMGRERVRTILIALANHIADTCELEHETRAKEKPHDNAD